MIDRGKNVRKSAVYVGKVQSAAFYHFEAIFDKDVSSAAISRQRLYNPCQLNSQLENSECLPMTIDTIPIETLGFLLLLLLIVALLLNIAISTLRLGISPTPSNRGMRTCCAELLSEVTPKDQPAPTLFIAGSGWGGLAFHLAKSYPGPIIGVEGAFYPWLWSRCWAWCRRQARQHQVHFIKSKVAQKGIPANSIVVCYLYPQGVQELHQLMTTAEHQAFGLLSIAFAVNQRPPDQTKIAKDWMKTPLYWYSSNPLSRK